MEASSGFAHYEGFTLVRPDKFLKLLSSLQLFLNKPIITLQIHAGEEND